MAPVVDGPGSIDVYYECLDACQARFIMDWAASIDLKLCSSAKPFLQEGLQAKTGIYNVVDEHSYMLYHLGSGPKFVKHAFERTCANAWGTQLRYHTCPVDQSLACMCKFLLVWANSRVPT